VAHQKNKRFKTSRQEQDDLGDTEEGTIGRNINDFEPEELAEQLSRKINMNKLSKDKRDKVRQFINFTQTGETTAIQCLTNANWNLEMACDIFYQNPSYFQQIDSSSSSDNRKLDQFFGKYANGLNFKGISFNKELHHTV
jgi:hypothetical protein